MSRARNETFLASFAPIRADDGKVVGALVFAVHPLQVEAVSWVKQDGIGMEVPLANIPGAPKAEQTASAPHVGQHSVEVLEQWGVLPAKIDELVTRGAVSAA